MDESEWLKDVAWQVRSADAQLVQAQVARHLKSFSIHRKAGARYQGHVAHTKVGRLELTLIGYGAEVEIDAGQLGSFSILQWPITGHYVLHVGPRSLSVTQDIAHVIPSGVPVRMVFSPDCLLLVVRMSAQGARALGAEIDASDALARNASEALGLPVSLIGGAGATLERTLNFLAQESFCGALLSKERAAGRLAEDLYLAALKQALNATPSAQPPTQATANAAPPLYVARAQTFLLNHLTDQITLKDVAAASGVSASVLNRAFRQHCALSPMAWWRMKRLDRAYEDLNKAGITGQSVTDIGFTWGFYHLGRFASAYARRFGETPRQTRQRARATLK